MDEATNEASINHKIFKKPFESTIGRYIDESVYRDIDLRLGFRERYCENWTKYSKYWNGDTVRLYTLLRMLGFRDGDNVFTRFEREQVDDFWLPLNSALLEKLKSDSLPELDVLEFTKAQFYVMSDSKQMDEENLIRPFFACQYNRDRWRSRPQHRYLEHGIAHFKDLGQIGKGSSAHVRHFRLRQSARAFACKRLPRFPRETHTSLKDHRKQLEFFKKEIDALGKLEYHHHVVNLVASFTDLTSFSLILDPIADRVLLDLLEQPGPLSDQEADILYKSFNCLATALEFLHDNSIRHKDIKPSNILLSSGRVLLCDFGISHTWTDSENGTTEGYSSFTQRYAAPEVFRMDASRNSKADIWSLGCVFLEVISVIKGYSFDQTRESRGFSATEMAAWLKIIDAKQDNTLHALPVGWIFAMIHDEPGKRLDAGTIVTNIHADATRSGLTAVFLASCCRKVEAETDAPGPSNFMQNLVCEPQQQIGPMHPTSDSLSSQSYRRESLLSSMSERSSGLARNASIASDSSAPQQISHQLRTRQGRSNLSSGPVSAVVYPLQTPVTTPGTSVRSNSDHYESLLSQNTATEAPSDERLHTRRVVWPITHGSPCGARTNEKRLFIDTIVTFSFAESATVERFTQCCDIAENTAQAFETARATNDTPIWEITRRLVLSKSTPTDKKICYSFWLPLTNVHVSHHEATVTLRWSDCNHVQRDSTGHWSWTYSHSTTNNKVNIQFREVGAAEIFVLAIRLPQGGGSTLKVSDTLDIHTWHESNSQDKLKPFISIHHEDSLHISRVYAICQFIDPLIRHIPHERQLSIQLNRLKRLTYLSDLRHLPSEGQRIARFEATKLIPCSLTVSAQFPTDIYSPVPPGSITTLFQHLTGWELRFSATVVQTNLARPRKLSPWKHYGTTDVMVWYRNAQDVVSASITFRLSEGSNVWMSGRISTLSSKDRKSEEAIFKFKMFGKQCGHVLDTRNMRAVPETTTSGLSPVDLNPDDQEEKHRVELHFQNLKQRQVFEALFEELASSISEDPPRLMTRTSLVIGSLIPGTPMGR